MDEEAQPVSLQISIKVLVPNRFVQPTVVTEFDVLSWLVVPYIMQAIYAGVKAGEHHAKLLQQNGYEDRGSVMALSEFDAIKKFHDEKTASG